MQPTTDQFMPAPIMATPDPSRWTEDARLHVEFHRVPVLNQFKSQQAGRAIYEERDFVKIHIPGDKNNIVDRPVDAIDEMRFADRLAKWRTGQAQAVDGTPLSALPTMTPGKVAEYAFFNIKTVEQLAGAADNVGQKFMSFQADKSRAKAFLEVAKGNAPVEQMNAELAKRDEQIETLKTMVEALQAQAKAPVPGKRALASQVEAA
jgi:hypothetical protein